MSEAVTPELERVELARQAMFQIEALLPIAQRIANDGSGEPDAMLGLLGRIEQMNDLALTLLNEVADADERREGVVERVRRAVLGRTT